MKFIIDLETFGLEPQTDRILSIGVMNLETEEIKVFIDADESKMLTQFWDYVINATDFITFNGDGFDLPYLIKRSLINRVRVTNIPPNHTDLRKIVNGFWFSYNRFEKGKLRDWCPALGITCETEDGSQMPALFARGDFEAIKQHNTEDLVMTRKLYKLIEYCNLIKN